VAEAAPVTADERELRECLHGCAAARSLADGHLTRIEGGLSNRAWRLEANGARWFVRLGYPQASSLGVDRHGECAVLHAVAAAGLAPAVHACDPARGLLVTSYIDGRTWTMADAQQPRNVRRAARCLRQLHQLPVPAGVHAVDFGQQAQRLAATLPEGDATAARLAGRAARAIERVSDGRGATALCHNDLHHLNLLDDGERLWLVDWEYGGRGNPLFDLASFLTLHDLAPAPAAAFLDAYGGLPATDRARLEDASWLYDYVQWLWYRSRFPSPAGDEAWYTERLAQRLLRCNN